MRQIGCVVLLLSLLGCVKPPGSSDSTSEQASHSQKASDINVQLGLGYLEQGNVQRAKAKLLRALEQGPRSVDALGAMAFFFEQTGDSQRAEHYYSKALSLAPGKGAQLNNYGAYLCRSGEYKAAEGYFMRAAADIHYVNSAGALENAGVCASQIPDVKAAKFFFHKALIQDPRRTRSAIELAKMALVERHLSEALVYVERAQASGNLRPDVSLLGYQIATQMGDNSQASDYAWILRHKFPDASETKKLPTKSEMVDERTNQYS